MENSQSNLNSIQARLKLIPMNFPIDLEDLDEIWRDVKKPIPERSLDKKEHDLLEELEEKTN